MTLAQFITACRHIERKLGDKDYRLNLVFTTGGTVKGYDVEVIGESVICLTKDDFPPIYTTPAFIVSVELSNG